MVKVLWSEEAFHDLDIIYDFIANKSIKAANSIIGGILSRTKQLKTFPQSGSIIEPLKTTTKKYRYFVEGNYKIIYSFDDKVVYVEMVFDTRKNPSILDF